MNVFCVGRKPLCAAHIDDEEQSEGRGTAAEKDEKTDLHRKANGGILRPHVAENPHRPSERLINGKRIRTVKRLSERRLILKGVCNELRRGDVREQQESKAGKHRSPVVSANVSGIRRNSIRSGLL